MARSFEHPDTHVGRHYKGELGEEYFGWQHRGNDLSGELERTKFERYVGSGDTVVDFGCGAGALLATLAAAERIGVEPNPPARAAGEERGLRMVASARELED